MSEAYRPTAAGGRATKTPVVAFQVQSSAPTPGIELAGGEELSLADYDATGWYVAPPRSTVMATLVGNGRFPKVEYSTNLRDVDAEAFRVPWWYRATFVARGDARTTLRFDGVIHAADLFVNGQLVATRERFAGAYPVHSFEVTGLVGEGTNAFALRVYPGHPHEDLSVSWVDWNQWPPDHNLGVWRDVVIERHGDGVVAPPAVRSILGEGRADLLVNVTLENRGPTAADAQLEGTITGNGQVRRFSVARQLPGGSLLDLELTAEEVAALAIEAPALWWPVGEGDQPMYELELELYLDGRLSDRQATSFGIRSVESRVEPGGGRRFRVNGRDLQLVGAGWSPDLFLRHDPVRLAAELEYCVDLGLNTIRLEGKLENPEFYDLADSLGIMALPGWECCSKWEAEKGPQGSAWTDLDREIARHSMESEAVLLRNHPSVVGFLIGSDFSPPEQTAKCYVDALRREHWSAAIVSSATAEGTEAAGPSGMKMTGPYSWVPPAYWFSRDPSHGGAIGFNSETAAGNNIPRLASLNKMLSPAELDELWKAPDAKQFHAGPPSEFDNLANFHRALSARYGPPTSLEDFVRKAHLADYEAVRAQFEAFVLRAHADEPATGVIYWMYNSAWPSLNWQLYDWYLDPAAAYFAAKKACSGIHALYDYGAGTVAVLNRTRLAAHRQAAEVTVRRLDGTVTSSVRHELGEIPPLGVVDLGPVAPPAGGEATYLLELSLDGAAHNVYWLSSTTDEIAWDQHSWQYTPTTRFADLRGLEGLANGTLEVSADPGGTRRGRRQVTVVLRNGGETPPALLPCLARPGGRR